MAQLGRSPSRLQSLCSSRAPSRYPQLPPHLWTAPRGVSIGAVNGCGQVSELCEEAYGLLSNAPFVDEIPAVKGLVELWKASLLHSGLSADSVSRQEGRTGWIMGVSRAYRAWATVGL